MKGAEMGQLKDWAQSKSNFIKLADGETVEGEFQGSKFTQFRGNDIVEYTIDPAQPVLVGIEDFHAAHHERAITDDADHLAFGMHQFGGADRRHAIAHTVEIRG